MRRISDVEKANRCVCDLLCSGFRFRTACEALLEPSPKTSPTHAH